MSKSKHLKGLLLTGKICLTATTVLFAIISTASSIAMENAGTISAFLNQPTQILEPDPDARYRDLEYYKSAFDNLSDVKNNGRVYAETVVDEGLTLLKNSNKEGNPVLPLGEGASVSLFSTSSVQPILSGTGSGGGGTENVSLIDGIEDAGLTVNRDLYTWYEENFGTYGRQWPAGASGVGKFATIGDAPWDVLPEAKNQRANAAVFVLSRTGGEGMDLTAYEDDNNFNVFNSNYTVDYKDGNYLKLSDTERDILTNLCAQRDNGVFDSVIVIMNSANPVQCDFVDEIGIDGLIWAGSWGSQGAYAIGEVLSGAISPSGKLSDTFWKYHYLNPVLANYGTLVNGAESPLVNQWRQTSASTFQNAVDAGTDTDTDSIENIVYQEGIYMGYRYTETRYEDFVMKKGNAGNFDYNQAVAYPFGYGLSYSTFEYSNFNVVPGTEEIDHKLYDKYTITVDVTNTGDVTAKEAVQLYLQKPYIEGGIEKASVELVDFGKTPLLESGQTATITMEVSGKDLASYDSYDAKTYVVDEGTYYFTVAKDSHEAINNILANKGYTTQDGMTEAGDPEMVYSFDKEEDKTTYSTSLATGNQITNKFDNADLNIYDNANEANHVDYISRSDWTGTVKYGLNADNTRTYDREVVIPTQQMKDDLEKSWGGVTSCKAQPTLIPEEAKTSDRGYPTFGSTSTSYTLAMLRAKADEDEDPTNDEWIDYNDPMWDDLLDQMTWDDLVSLLSDGERKNVAMGSVSKPAVIDHNGGNGPNQSYSIGASNEQGLATRKNDPLKNESPVVYPCNGIVASTFNKELAYYYGCQWGEDMLWAGMAGLYGMGMNIHRSAYGGRNFEYYSEDPLLMGVIAGETVRGMATRGAYVYLKHCVLNDQETYRCGGFTWANEQTIREIYLKPYEIAISEYGAQGVMGSLNSIGMMSSGTQGFFNTVLRDEFGMTGAAVTDTTSAMGGNFAVSVFTGNDLPDGTISDDAFDFAAPTSEGGTGEYGEFAWAMRESAHRILYTVVHSNAMNGIAATDKIYKITPDWIKAVNAIQISFGVLLGLSAAEVLVCIFLINKDNLKKIFVHHDDEEAN